MECYQKQKISLSVQYKFFTKSYLCIKSSLEKNDSKSKNNYICFNILNYTINYHVFFILLNSLTFKLQICLQICRFSQITRPIFYCDCTIQDGGIPCIYKLNSIFHEKPCKLKITYFLKKYITWSLLDSCIIGNHSTFSYFQNYIVL